jgi:hypothetical protein
MTLDNHENAYKKLQSPNNLVSGIVSGQTSAPDFDDDFDVYDHGGYDPFRIVKLTTQHQSLMRLVMLLIP